jgi:hypothetical protein
VLQDYYVFVMSLAEAHQNKGLTIALPNVKRPAIPMESRPP